MQMNMKIIPINRQTVIVTSPYGLMSILPDNCYPEMVKLNTPACNRTPPPWDIADAARSQSRSEAEELGEGLTKPSFPHNGDAYPSRTFPPPRDVHRIRFA